MAEMRTSRMNESAALRSRPVFDQASAAGTRRFDRKEVKPANKDWEERELGEVVVLGYN